MVCGFLAMEVMMNVLSTREDGVTLIPRKLSGWGLALRSEDVVPIYCVRGSPEYTCRPGWPSGGLTPCRFIEDCSACLVSPFDKVIDYKLISGLNKESK